MEEMAFRLVFEEKEAVCSYNQNVIYKYIFFKNKNAAKSEVPNNKLTSRRQMV